MYLKVEMKIYEDWGDLHELCHTECKISVNSKEPNMNIDQLLNHTNDHLFRVLMAELNEQKHMEGKK